MDAPPSTSSAAPVTKAESSDARYSAVRAISCGVPTRPAASRIFARTDAEGAVVVITGYGPSDTHYVK